MKINKYKLLEFFSISFLSLTPLLWFKNNSLVLGHDSGFRIKFLEYLYDLFYSWNPNVGFGADLSINKGFLITQFPETFFSYLTGSLRTGEMLTFVFWFFAIGISMYVFVNSFFPKKEFWLFRIFSSLFYMFNFFILQAWFIAERAKFSLFAALPLGFLVLYKTFIREYSLIKGAVLFSLIFFILNGGSSPPLYGAVLLSFSVLVLYFTFLQLLRRNYREIIYYAKIVFSFALASLLVNAYWVLPQIYLIFSSYSRNLSAQGGIEGILGWESVVSKYASTINLLRFQGIPDWYENVNHAYSNLFQSEFLLIVASFIPAIIILLGLYYYKSFSTNLRNDRLFFLMCFIFLAGLVFSAGSHPPFGALYVQFIKYIPGFAIFRSAFYKFGPAFWFSAAFLCGYLLNLLLIHFVKSKKYFSLIACASILLLVSYNFPYFKGDFFKWNPPFSTSVHVPEYVYEMSDYINENTDVNSRVLLLPSLDPDPPNADSYEWGFWSLDTLPLLSIDRSTIANTNYAPKIISDMYKSLELGDLSSFNYGLEILGIDKVLWRDDVLYSNKISNSENLKDKYSRFFAAYDSPQKKIGEWEIYGIADSDVSPIIFSPSKVSYSERDISVLSALQSQDKPKKPIFVNLTQEGEQVSKLVKSKAQYEIVSAECISCESNDLWELQKNKKILPAQIVPGSLFYPFIEASEKKTFDQSKDIPTARIDADLSQATTRLRELYSLAMKNASGEHKENIISVITKYQKSMEDASTQVEKLSDFKKNEYLIRYLNFLQMHHNYLGAIEDRQNIPEKELSELLNFQKEKNDTLRKMTWITTSNDSKKYLFQITTAGEYVINYLPNIENEVFIDGQPVRSEVINLQKGTHHLELKDSEIENLLILDTSSPIDFYLTFGESKTFEMNDFSNKNKYLVEFDYILRKGKNPYFSIDQSDKLKEAIELENKPVFQLDSINNKFYYLFSPHPAASNVAFRFFTDANSDELSNFQLQNFKITKLENPNIVLSRRIENVEQQSPEVSYERISPTKYEVEIRNAKKPYFLAFNQNYSNGWGLISKGERLPVDHFKINGFANVWYVEKMGDYKLGIEYKPQEYAGIGVVITILSLASLPIIYLVKRKNAKKV